MKIEMELKGLQEDLEKFIGEKLRQLGIHIDFETHKLLSLHHFFYQKEVMVHITEK